jgi:hypothetical protein
MAHGTWNMRHDKHTITTSLVTVMWRGVDRHRVLGSMSMPRHVAAPSPPHLRLSPPVHPIRLVLSYFPCGASQSPHRPARPRPSCLALLGDSARQDVIPCCSVPSLLPIMLRPHVRQARLAGLTSGVSALHSTRLPHPTLLHRLCHIRSKIVGAVQQKKVIDM